MFTRWKLAIILFAPILIWCGNIAWDCFNPNSIAQQSVRLQLSLFGSAIYEFHSTTGHWPAKLDDLEQTSLPEKNRLWRETASTMAFLWPTRLKPEPRENSQVVLAYATSGLINRLGRRWVLWGDLRTEYVPRQDLRRWLGQ